MLQDKYLPKTSEDIIGQKNLSELKSNIIKKIPSLIYGPTGVGKTSSVYAIANELGYEVIEINSSDSGNKENFENLIGRSMNQRSLFYGGKIILIDELDSFSGRKDRGVVKSILEITKKSSFPVVITSNNPFEKKYSDLTKSCKLIQFDSISYLDLYSYLNKIILKEGIKIDDKLVRTIARYSKGDLRAALMDLFTVSTTNSCESLSDRGVEEELIYYLNIIFKSKDINLIKKATDNANINLDEMIMWLDENIPLIYDNSELSEAYDCLSKSVLFKGRIMKRQYFRYLVYQKFYSTFKLALAKNKSKEGILTFKRNQRILKVWIANRKKAKNFSNLTSLKENLRMSFDKLLKENNYMTFLD